MSQVTCPVCQQRFNATHSRAMPFCSERCRQVDLGRWLREEYGLPWESPEEPSEFDLIDPNHRNGHEE